MVTIFILLFLCITPVAANVTYPQEYYKLTERSDNILTDILKSGTVGLANYGTQVFQSYELRRQNILLEKQNELQAELVKAQWVETCYTAAKVQNISAWKSECANAGYPVG